MDIGARYDINLLAIYSNNIIKKYVTNAQYKNNYDKYTIDNKLKDDVVLTANKVEITPSDPRIVYVDVDGRIVGNSPGSTTINIKCGVLETTVAVEVYQAEKLEKRNGVPYTKIWTINFNKPIDKNTINKNNIIMTDTQGNIIDLVMVESNDGKSVSIGTLNYQYEKGKTYTLFISNKIKCLQGVNDYLKNPYTMDFTISQ